MDTLGTIARLGAAAVMLVAAAVVGGQVEASGAVSHTPVARAAAVLDTSTAARGSHAPKDGYLRAGTLMSSCGNMDLG